MESESLNPISPDTGDTESKMRRNLGLDGAASDGSTPLSSSNDPLKSARQAIRSQVTAREYTERQLAQAQTAIQDLRTRMRHVHQERESAVSAAQSAMMAKDTAERNMKAAESTLATEKATRLRTEGMLRDAEATIRDLREKLATANQSLHLVQAELAAERQARPIADGTAVAAVALDEITAPTAPEPVVPIARRPVGRPRKTLVVDWGEASLLPIRERQVVVANATPTVRRPVGRPRKITVAQPVGESGSPSEMPNALAKGGTKNISKYTDDQEPVQWWVEGSKNR